MSAARIVIVQAGVAGAAGTSRDDIVVGSAVTLQNEDDTGVRSWRWRFKDKPTASAATLSNSVAAQVTFTPDVPGSYLIELKVDDGLTGQVDTRIAAVREAVGVVTGLRMPAASESSEANWSGNTRGAFPDIESWLRAAAGAAADHGVLTGLADDDHTHYILVTGTRAFSGNMFVGGTSSGTVTPVVGANPSISTQVSSTTATTTIGHKLYVNEGSRNTRVAFYLTDGAAAAGSWGHWLTFGSSGAQPYQVGMITQTLLNLAAISQNSAGTSFIAGSQNNSTITGTAFEVRGGAGGSVSGAGGAVTLIGGAATDGNGGAANITGRAGTGTNRSGGNVTVVAGNATGTGAAGDVSVNAGSAATTGAAGEVSIVGGNGGSVSGAGGAATLQGGAGAAGNGGSASVLAGSAAGATGTGGQAGLFGGSGQGGSAGGAVAILAGTGGATGVGGTVSITGGDGGATSGAGGSVALIGGDSTLGAAGNVTVFGGTSVDGDGGYIDLTGGEGIGTNRTGGIINISAGASTGTAAGAYVAIAAGSGGSSAAGGLMQLAAGTGGSASGAGGDVNIIAGDPGSADGFGGNVNINGGNATGNGAGGDIILTPGTGASGSDTHGAVHIVGQLSLSDIISPSALASGTTSDYSPTGLQSANVIRVAADAAGSTLTGIDPTGCDTNKFVLLINTGTAGSLTLSHDTTSAASARFYLSNGASVIIRPYAMAALFYDNTSLRWRVLS